MGTGPFPTVVAMAGADVLGKAMGKRPRHCLPAAQPAPRSPGGPGAGKSRLLIPIISVLVSSRAGAPCPCAAGARPDATAVGPVEDDPTFDPAEQLCG